MSYCEMYRDELMCNPMMLVGVYAGLVVLAIAVVAVIAMLKPHADRED